MLLFYIDIRLGGSAIRLIFTILLRYSLPTINGELQEETKPEYELHALLKYEPHNQNKGV